MLLDWIGAGSGTRSNPIQKVRRTCSWFSSRDPIALFPFLAISKWIQVKRFMPYIFKFYMETLSSSLEVLFSSNIQDSHPPHCHCPHCHCSHCHRQRLLPQLLHPGHQTPLYYESRPPSSLSQGCQKGGAQVVHSKPASTRSPQLYPSGVVNDDR